MAYDTLAEGQPFQEAADFFGQKLNLPTQRWTDIREGEHGKAFVVAGVSKAALLADFRSAIDRAVRDGETLADFRKRFDEIVQRHGWSYKGQRGWRTRVIYQTNVRQAYSAGRWQQAQRLRKSHPYLVYEALDDGRTRPEHAAWDGIVLRADDSWWDTHTPMNGWGCRCSALPASQRELERRGLSVSEPPPVEMENRPVNTSAGRVNWPTPKGVDAGFGYNVGRAAYGDIDQQQAMSAWPPNADQWRRQTQGSWKSADRPREIPADEAARPASPSLPDDRRAYVRQILGGNTATVELPDGSRATLSAKALADNLDDAALKELPRLQQALEDPRELWLAFERHAETGQMELRHRFVRRHGNTTLTAQLGRNTLEVVHADDGDGANRHRVGHLIRAR